MALVLGGCVSPPPKVFTPPPSRQMTAGGGRLDVPLSSDVLTLQPVLTTDETSARVWSLIYLPLLDTDPDNGALRPGLAESYVVSADGKTITFTLRPGFVWSDGEPVTGDDYVYALDALARAKKGAGLEDAVAGYREYAIGRSDRIAGLSVSDSGRVIQVSLARTLCNVLQLLNMPLLPKHSFVHDWQDRVLRSTGSLEQSPLNNAPPASVGPFQFMERTPAFDITLVRNDRYYKGPPLLDRVVFHVGADAASFLRGEVTYAEVFPDEVARVRGFVGKSAQLVQVPRPLVYTFIGWNEVSTRAPWLADKRVRQALSYGLDVEGLLQGFPGVGTRVYAHTPSSSWAYGGAGLNAYKYDKTKAKQLLEEAGATMGTDGIYRWRDGRAMRMRIETNNGAVRRAVLDNAVDEYRLIGIAIDPVVEPFATLMARVKPGNKDVDGFIHGWQLASDPDAYGFWHSGLSTDSYNLVSFANAEVDRAVEAGRNGPDCSDAARKSAYVTMNRVLNDEAAYTFLFSTDQLFFVSSRLQDAEFKPYAMWTNIERWRLLP